MQTSATAIHHFCALLTGFYQLEATVESIVSGWCFVFQFHFPYFGDWYALACDQPERWEVTWADVSVTAWSFFLLLDKTSVSLFINYGGFLLPRWITGSPWMNRPAGAACLLSTKKAGAQQSATTALSVFRTIWMVRSEKNCAQTRWLTDPQTSYRVTLWGLSRLRHSGRVTSRRAALMPSEA